MAGRRFRYSVVRYVRDHARDEAVNMGVLLSPADGGRGASKTVNRGILRRHCGGKDQARMLGMVMDSLVEECLGGIPLERLEKKYVHRIRLSRPMPILVDDPAMEVADLFNRFVSITSAPDPGSGKNTGIMTPIKDHVWSIIGNMDGADRNVPVTGRRYTSTFDFAYTNGSFKMVHFMDLGSKQALRAVRLFDWSVSDVMDVGPHSLGSFIPVLACKGGERPTEERLKEHAEAAVRILDGYAVQYLDTMNWKDGVRRIFA